MTDFLPPQSDFSDSLLDYRRDKRWKIFSWASSLLLGGIAVVNAITIDSNKQLPLFPHKVSLITAIIVLAAYAITWMYHNGKREDIAWENMRQLDDKLNLYQEINFTDPNSPVTWPKYISYGLTVALIALTAVIIVLLS